MGRSPICINLTYHENDRGKSSQTLTVQTAVMPADIKPNYLYYILGLIPV